MDPALPWYRSPVYVGIVTSIISQLIALTGRADLFPTTDAINGYVDAVFQVIALVMLIVAEVKRRKSAAQPLTLTKAGAEKVAAQTNPPKWPCN